MFRGTPRKDTSAHGAWSTVGAFSLMEAAKSAESPKAQAIATKERSPTHSSAPTAQRRVPIAKDCAPNRTEHRAIPRHPENRWEPAMRATQIRGAMGNEGQPPATLHSKGCADVAIGVERLAKELPGLAFVPPANRMARHRRREEPAHRTACAGDSQDCGKRVLSRRDRRNRGLRSGEHGSHRLRELDARRGLQDAGEETHFLDVRICR